MSIKTHQKRKFKKPSNKSFLFWLFGHTQSRQRGAIGQVVILVIVLIGAFYLVGGFFPSNFLSQSNTPFDGIPDEKNAQSPEESLQLGTIPFKKCSSIVTMDLLLDNSGSMDFLTPSFTTKISRLQQAVSTLTNKMSDDSIIGIQTFRSIGDSDPQPILAEPVPISYYKDVKTILPSAIAGMPADGGTPTYDALTYTYQKLQEALPKFPDRKFNLIMISDGAPCPGIGCSGPRAVQGKDQDPRIYSPNPADQIKDLGVNIYTVGIYSGGIFGQQDPSEPKLRELLIDIASSPDNYYEARTGDDVTSLLSQISNKICEGDDALTPTP